MWKLNQTNKLYDCNLTISLRKHFDEMKLMCSLYLDLIGARTNDLLHWRRHITTPMWFEMTATWEVALHVAIIDLPTKNKKQKKNKKQTKIYIQPL